MSTPGKRFNVVVTKDKVNFGIPSIVSIAAATANDHGHDSWKVKVHHFLSGQVVQYTLMGLLCLDVLIIFAEIFLKAEFPDCRVIKRDCLACCSESYSENDAALRLLAAESSGHGICEDGYETTGQAACDDHNWEVVHTVENVLFYFTASILGIFLVENVTELVVLGFRRFFTQFFLVLDFFVVLVSLVLELVFHYNHSKFTEVVGLIIFLRLWRFVRIGHAVAEVVSELTSKEYEPLIEYVKECEKILDEHTISKPERISEVTDLIEGHH
jgi:hypothetical protein